MKRLREYRRLTALKKIFRRDHRLCNSPIFGPDDNQIRPSLDIESNLKSGIVRGGGSLRKGGILPASLKHELGGGGVAALVDIRRH